MNILYIAYSCSPNHGSEDRIGWKIPIASAENNKVFVITKGEHRKVIEEYRKDHSDLNVVFFYVDIPSIYKKLFKGFAYSGRLRRWQKSAIKLAQKVCVEHEIDIIHQITPVEYRSIGDYGKIHDTKFICGPIGGGEYIPKGLAGYARKHTVSELIRRAVNAVSLFSLKLKGTLKRCDMLLFANRETEKYLSGCAGAHTAIKCMSEVGIGSDEIVEVEKTRDKENCVFLVAGRLNYRKGHELLLDAMSLLPSDLAYECHVVGTGRESKALIKKCEKLGLNDRLTFFGRVPFDEMTRIYENAHVLVLPSLRETTGSVILEAMSRALPVVTVDRFGGAVLVNSENGWLYSGNSKEEYKHNLSAVLAECIRDPQEVSRRAQNAVLMAKNNTWDRKMEYYDSVYREML